MWRISDVRIAAVDGPLGPNDRKLNFRPVTFRYRPTPDIEYHGTLNQVLEQPGLVIHPNKIWIGKVDRGFAYRFMVKACELGAGALNTHASRWTPVMAARRWPAQPSATFRSTKVRRSWPQNDSPSTMYQGEPKTPRVSASAVASSNAF